MNLPSLTEPDDVEAECHALRERIDAAMKVLTLLLPDEDYRGVARSYRGTLASAAILGLLSAVTGARAALASATAQTEALRVPVWRDIASAPKDGTHILVGTFPCPAGRITTAVVHWFDGDDAGWALSVNYDGEHSDHGVSAPTHWMPLPAPPEAHG